MAASMKRKASRRPDGGSAAAAIDRADDLRRGRPVAVELEHRAQDAGLHVGACDAVPREVEAVRVGLEPVTQRDPRHR